VVAKGLDNIAVQGRPVRALCDGQSRGKQNTHKVCKKKRKFPENRGKFLKVGEIIMVENVVKQ